MCSTHSGMTKTQVLQIRFTNAEKQESQPAADLTDIPLSAWVRERPCLASIGELESTGQKVPFITPVHRNEPESLWYWPARRISSNVVNTHKQTTRSVSRTSKGVGSSPAISALMRSSFAHRASSARGSPPAELRASTRPALRPTSEALPTTSAEEARTFRRSFLRASLSPASALSERVLSSAMRSLVSFESSSSPFTSVHPLVLVVSGGYEVGAGEDFRRLRTRISSTARGGSG